jgi:hypothetical protein
MTIGESIRAITGYPIPPAAVSNICEAHGLNADDKADMTVRSASGYNLAKADTYRYLSTAPNITQGGVSYSFSEDERDRFVNLADRLSSRYGDAGGTAPVSCGYVGEDF